MNEETKDQEVQDEKVQETAEETNAAEASEEVEKEQEDKEDFEAKYHEVNDKFLRLYSEFENFRRRTAKEKVDMLANAKAESLKNMLPVVDDFERAMLNNDNTEEVNALKEGFVNIHKKFLNTLTQSGLTPMATEVGDDFDTDKHEAITQIPAPEEGLKGKVVDVIEKGYVTKDKVIRYAKVVIGN